MSKILIAAAVALLASSAFAGESKSVAVSTVGTDFHNRVEVQSFYSRISLAAQDACRIDSTNKYVASSDTDCVRRAISDAVKSADRPLLTAIYQNGNLTALASNER